MLPLEQETVIRFDETTERIAELYTSSKRVADLLARRGIEPYKVDKHKGRGDRLAFPPTKAGGYLKAGDPYHQDRRA